MVYREEWRYNLGNDQKKYLPFICILSLVSLLYNAFFSTFRDRLNISNGQHIIIHSGQPILKEKC